MTVSKGISRETQGGLHLYGKTHCVSSAPKASKAQNSAYRLSLSTGPWQPKALRHSSAPLSLSPSLHATPFPLPSPLTGAPLNPKPCALAGKRSSPVFAERLTLTSPEVHISPHIDLSAQLSTNQRRSSHFFLIRK